MQQKVFLGVCLSLALTGARAQSFEWGGRFGGIGEDVVRELHVDAAGNSYTTGYFTDSADFAVTSAQYMLTSNGFFDVFVQKTGPDGNLLWAKGFGGSGFDYGTGITTDAQGNVYVTGVYEESPDFDPGAGTVILPSHGGQDIFLVKYDAAGTFVWARNFGSGGYDESTTVGTDGDGNIYLSGYFNDTADFDPGPGAFELIGAGMNDNFVVKLTPAGDFVWAKRFGGAFFEAALAMKVTASGEQYITGFYNGMVDFDPGTGEFFLMSSPGNTGFLLKLDSAGSFQLARSFDATEEVICYDVDLDATGNIYLTGTFRGTVDLDPGTDTLKYTSVQSNGFVVKLNPSAQFIWGKNIESAEAVISYSVDVNTAGHVMTSGYIENTTDFDPDPAELFELSLSSANAAGAFISILDNSGDFINALEFGGCNFLDYHGAYTDAANNIYISGAFETTVDVNPDPAPLMVSEVTAMDFRDNYLIKMRPFQASLPKEGKTAELRLFPNPATDVVSIKMNGFKPGQTYSVYDQTGREVKAGQLQAETSVVSVADLSAGVYVVRLSGNRSLRFVKK